MRSDDRIGRGLNKIISKSEEVDIEIEQKRRRF
jgi:hypothetical protein